MIEDLVPETPDWPSAPQACARLTELLAPLGHDLEIWEWLQHVPDYPRRDDYCCVRCRMCDVTYDTSSLSHIMSGWPEPCPGPEGAS